MKISSWKLTLGCAMLALAAGSAFADVVPQRAGRLRPRRAGRLGHLRRVLGRRTARMRRHAEKAAAAPPRRARRRPLPPRRARRRAAAAAKPAPASVAPDDRDPGRRAVRLRQVGGPSRRQEEHRCRARQAARRRPRNGHRDRPHRLDRHRAYNQKLSERRAAAVKDYLVSKGIPAAKITTIGKGETAAGGDQQDRGRPPEEPPRGHRVQGRARSKLSGPAENPAAAGFFVRSHGATMEAVDTLICAAHVVPVEPRGGPRTTTRSRFATGASSRSCPPAARARALRGARASCASSATC